MPFAAFFYLAMTISEFYKKDFRPGIISTDSRKISKGSIFIALKGDNFNGNDYAIQALHSGASIAVVDELIEGYDDQIIVVKNTLSFLQELAHYHRIKSKFNIIGLTGSNGKTTTKELIHIVLSERYKVQSTQGNLNNHIGVPLSLLSIEYENEYCVIEMGANHLGEIMTLCEIAEPDSGIITNIGKAHLEGFGSLEGVVKAKSELRDFIVARNGKLFCNGSDKLLQKIAGSYKNCLFYNSIGSICTGRIITSTPNIIVEITDRNNNSVIVNSHLYGGYNLINILAAACVGIDHGITLEEIKIGIEKYHPSNLRSQVLQIGSSTVIMDCYNANPSSMELALQNAANYKLDRKIVILGSMKELGNYTYKEHKKLAKLAEGFGFEEIILFGEEFKDIIPSKGISTDSFNTLINYLQSIELHHSLILIKGSRANRLERLQDIISNYHSSRS